MNYKYSLSFFLFNFALIYYGDYLEHLLKVNYSHLSHMNLKNLQDNINKYYYY